MTTEMATGDIFPRSRDDARLNQVLTSGVALHIPAGLSFESWTRTGCQLSSIVDSSAWWLGDWLVYGKSHYVDCYQESIKRAGLRYQTLRNYAWIARRFPIDRRRRALTFQHHAEVASLTIDEQERLLDLAESGNWTTKQLRGAIRQDPSDTTTSQQPVSTNSRVDMPGSRVAVWRKAADSLGLGFDEWVLMQLDRAASEVLTEVAVGV